MHSRILRARNFRDVKRAVEEDMADLEKHQVFGWGIECEHIPGVSCAVVVLDLAVG